MLDLERGGGPHGTEGKLPERPCVRKGSFGGGSDEGKLVSFEVVVVSCVLVDSPPFVSSS